MDIETKQLLARWTAVEQGPGLQLARKVAFGLRLIGMGLMVLVAVAIVYGVHPAIVALAALALGWVIAEHNALRSRFSQWPIMRHYIDWKRVEEDLRDKAP